MKGIIQLAVEVDYEEVAKNGDMETLKLFTGSSSELDVLKYHLDGLSRHLTQVVSEFEFVNYYIESDLLQDEKDGSTVEQASEELVESEGEIEEGHVEESYEDEDVNVEEGLLDGDHSTEEENLWSEVNTNSLAQDLMESYLSANDRGTVMKIVVNENLEEFLKQEIDNQGWGVDVQSEAMEELYGIVIDPTEETDLGSEEFIVIFKGKDGSEYSQVSIW